MHASKVDAFVDALERRIAALPVGHGFDDGTMIGPLINPAAAAKVDARVRASGGRTLVGGACFGAGWGLGGLCPGPGVVSVGTGSLPAAVWLGAMVAGRGLASTAPAAKAS